MSDSYWTVTDIAVCHKNTHKTAYRSQVNIKIK